VATSHKKENDQKDVQEKNDMKKKIGSKK